MFEPEQYRQGFEKLIKEDPYDIHTRLIFADWLEENNFPDEAAEQRRKGTKGWVKADKWMHDFANKCGSSCRNYSEGYRLIRNRIRDEGLNYRNEEERSRIDQLYEEIPENWQPITYEECIQARYAYLDKGDYFVQMGDEQARDMMHGKTARDFWENWSIITGEQVPASFKEGEEGSAPFSCSC